MAVSSALMSFRPASPGSCATTLPYPVAPFSTAGRCATGMLIPSLIRHRVWRSLSSIKPGLCDLIDELSNERLVPKVERRGAGLTVGLPQRRPHAPGDELGQCAFQPASTQRLSEFILQDGKGPKLNI